MFKKLIAEAAKQERIDTLLNLVMQDTEDNLEPVEKVQEYNREQEEGY